MTNKLYIFKKFFSKKSGYINSSKITSDKKKFKRLEKVLYYFKKNLIIL